MPYQAAIDIAEQVRIRAERLQKQHQFPRDMCGLCAIASAQLHRELYDAGFNSRLVGNSGHFFVQLDNHFVIDITATQFKFERVLCFSRRDLPSRLYSTYHHQRWWENKVEFETAEELIHYQIETGWIKNQVAYDHRW